MSASCRVCAQKDLTPDAIHVAHAKPLRAKGIEFKHGAGKPIAQLDQAVNNCLRHVMNERVSECGELTLGPTLASTFGVRKYVSQTQSNGRLTH